MGKLFKILGVLLGVLILLAIAGVIAIPFLVEPNDFKDPITDRVKQATGRDLRIEGDLSLSVFPWFELELNALKLGNAPGFGSEPFAAVQHARIEAQLIPLLRRQLVVEKVRVEGVRINLLRDEAGNTNWQDLVQQSAAPAPTETDAAQVPYSEARTSAQGLGLAAYFVGAIELADGQLRWDDRLTGQRVSLQELELSTGAIEPGQPVALDLGFSIDNQEPPLAAQIKMTGRLALSETLETLRAEPLEIQVSNLKTGEGLSAAAALTTTLHLDLVHDTGILKPLRLEIMDLKTSDGLTAHLGLAADVALDLAAQQYRIGDIELTLNGRDQRFPSGELAAKATAAILIDMAEQTLDLENLHLRSNDLEISAEAKGTQLLEQPRFRGKLTVAELNLRNWMQHQGLAVPESADPKTLQRLSLHTNWQLAGDQVSLDGLQLQLDESNVNGTVRVVNLAQPGYRFDLQLDRIDVDRYLPPASAEPSGQRPQTKQGEPPTSKKTPQRPAKQAAPPMLPTAWLRGLDLEGQLSIGQMALAGLDIGQSVLKVKAKGGQLDLDHQVKRFYGGKLKGNLVVDARGEVPRLRLVEQTQGIQAGPLLRDLTGEDRLTGTGGFNADLQAAGSAERALKQSLGGKLDFRFTNGAVKGFNLARTIREASAKLKGEPLPPSKEPLQTDFSELAASAVIANGVAKNEDLAAKSPYLRVTGRGSVDIAAETLDYRLKPIVVKSPRGQGGKDLKELEGIPIPVHLTGPWAKPNWEIDIAAVLKDVGKEKLIEKVEKDERVKRELDKLEEKTGIKGLGESLKGLFGK